MKREEERIKLENKKKQAREVFIKEKITEGFKLSLNPKTLTKINNKFEEKYILQDKYIIKKEGIKNEFTKN